jgi:hypothetical protein
MLKLAYGTEKNLNKLTLLQGKSVNTVKVWHSQLLCVHLCFIAHISHSSRRNIRFYALAITAGITAGRVHSIRGLGSLPHQIYAFVALVCTGNVLGNGQHAGAGATQGRSCFLIIGEVGAEEGKVTHTYNAYIKGHKIVRKIISHKPYLIKFLQ